MTKLLRNPLIIASLFAILQPSGMQAMSQKTVTQDLIFDILKNDNLNETQKIELLEIALKEDPTLINTKSVIGGITPLHWACEEDYLNIVIFLIEHGADTNVTYYNATVLQWAVYQGKRALIKLLLEKGISKGLNINNRSMPSRETALGLAVGEGYTDIVELLVSYGADINTETVCGCTLLDNAVMRRDLKTVRYLVTHDADLSLPDSKTVHTLDRCFGTDENIELTNYLWIATAFHATLKGLKTFESFITNQLQTDKDIDYVKELLPLDKEKKFTNKFNEWCKQNKNTTSSVNTNLNTITTTANGLTNTNLCATTSQLFNNN